jgi:hypothetical protein
MPVSPFTFTGELLNASFADCCRAPRGSGLLVI